MFPINRFGFSSPIPPLPGTCVGSGGRGWPGHCTVPWFECTGWEEEESWKGQGFYLQVGQIFRQASQVFREPTDKVLHWCQVWGTWSEVVWPVQLVGGTALGQNLRLKEPTLQTARWQHLTLHRLMYPGLRSLSSDPLLFSRPPTDWLHQSTTTKQHSASKAQPHTNRTNWVIAT